MFAGNALGLVAASQGNRALLRRLEPRTILRSALSVQALAGVALLVVVAAGAGVWGIVPLLFVVVASLGLVIPNATALALADHPRVAGSASGLLGVLQFIVGAAAAPLVGVGGTATALPMALTIAVLGVGGVLSATVVASRPHRLPRAGAPPPAPGAGRKAVPSPSRHASAGRPVRFAARHAALTHRPPHRRCRAP